MFQRDDATAELLRRATAESGTDMATAIETLRLAHARMRASPASYPVETWLRLPLYLQKAGRMREALDEFRRLADSTRWRISHVAGHQPEAVQAKLRAAEHATIREKLALAMKRHKSAETKAKKGGKPK